MNINETLLEIGFSEKESKVYLTLLREGELNVTKISQITGIDRVNTYQIIEKLKNKGFLGYFVKDNKQFFTASNPETILAELERKKNLLLNKMDELKLIKNKKTDEAKVEIFKGKQGIKKILRLMANLGDYHFLGGLQEICTKFPEDAHIYIKIAQEKKFRGKIIARKKDDFFIGENEDYRYLPKKQISTTSSLIVENKTVLFVWDNPYYAILIESKEISKNNLSNFDYLWRHSEKPSKEDIKKRLIK